MTEELSETRQDLRRQPAVIVSLGIDNEILENESSEEDVLDEESEPTHEEIRGSYTALLRRPYAFQDFDETHLILARMLSITLDEDISMLIYENFDNLCKNNTQRVQAADNHIYSAPYIVHSKDDAKETYRFGVEFRNQFNHDGKLDDLERAISCMKKAVKITQETEPELPEYLSGLANTSFERFERFSGTEYLEDAILHQRRAISLLPDPEPIYQSSLGEFLLRRFQLTGSTADLEEAIEVQERSVPPTTDDTSNIEICCARLAGSLMVRFEQSSNLVDLDRAIDLYKSAIDRKLEVEMDTTLKHNLGSALQLKCLHLIDIGFIHEAITYQEAVVLSTSDQNTEKPRRLTSLGNSLHIKFEHLGDMADIERAIFLHHQVLDLLPKKHILRAGILNDLGKSYLLRFGDSGKLADIEQCLIHLMEAVRLTPAGSPEWFKRLFNLGHALRQKFESQGILADIDHAITVYYEAISAIPSTHIDRAEHLDHLGSAYMSRFERLRVLTDHNNAIELYRGARSIYGTGNPKAQATLNNLGVALRQRFVRLGRYNDIDESIDVLREAIDLAAKQANMPALLNSLAVSLRARYTRSKQIEDIDESVTSLERAIELTPHNHPDMPFWLNNLYNSFRSRFELTESVEDLKLAIEYQTRAIQLIPEHHSERPAMTRVLGDALELRHLVQGKREGIDREDVVDAYRQAALSSVGSPYERFEAAYSWAGAVSQQGESPFEAYKLAFTLVPQVVWMGTTIHQRYHDVSHVLPLATRAVSAAIVEGEYSLALEWFEEGRSIVWRQMLDLRTPLDELELVDRPRAEELKRVAQVLDRAATSKPTRPITTDAAKSLDRTAQTHHRLAEYWDKLLDEVRQMDGFSDFLRPKKASTLMKAAHDGPVVAVIVNEIRCDALVLKSPNHLECVSLPGLSYQKASDAQRKLMRSLNLAGVRDRSEATRRPVMRKVAPPRDELKDVLEFLWVDVVHPILAHLNYLDPSGDELPHITWCVTGPLTFLPLHAAGRYTDPNPKSRVFNCVVSSYTPTVNGLVVPTTPSDNFSGILAIRQAATPGLSALPGTKRELEAIARHTESLQFTQLIDDSATPDTVLEALSNHSWVHFACHASQEPDDPTSSAFYLHNGTLDLNTITKQSLGPKAFAFLSACQTAAGDLDLPEEAVHLAAGMIMAGYPTVIGTMWSIRDNDAPLIAEHIYGEMLAGGKPDSAKAARALHRALRALRDQVGETAFVAWVPYIHIGI